MIARCVLGVMLVASITGCTVGPNYVRPSPAALSVPTDYGEATAQTGSMVDIAAWWSAFRDPTLDTLVERARVGSTDVAAATARIRIARAALRGARGVRLPAMSISASASRAIDTGTGSAAALTAGSLFGAGANVAFDPDLSGGLRRGVEAAEADLSAADFDLGTAEAALASDLVLAYLDLRSAQARYAIAADQLASQRHSAAIVGWRVRAGLAAQGDYESVRALAEQTAATLPLFEETARLATHQVAILTGQAPASLATLLDVPRPLPSSDASPPAGLPADLLRRRPDVRAAERRLAAETARIGVETAQLYPALNLTGSLTSSATSASAPPAAALTSIAGALTAPIFEGGRIRARIEAQRGQAALALANYHTAVLAAIGDVEDALVSFRTSAEREARLAAAADAASRALEQARGRYRGGLTDFQTLLTAERTLLAVRDTKAAAQADHARATAQLFRALGGGWADIGGDGA